MLKGKLCYSCNAVMASIAIYFEADRQPSGEYPVTGAASGWDSPASRGSPRSGRIGLIGSPITVTRLLDRQQLRPNLFLDLAGDFLVLLQERARIVLALANAAAL